MAILAGKVYVKMDTIMTEYRLNELIKEETFQRIAVMINNDKKFRRHLECLVGNIFYSIHIEFHENKDD